MQFLFKTGAKIKISKERAKKRFYSLNERLQNKKP